MITTEEWAKVCGHVDKVVAKYMETEHLLDEASDEFKGPHLEIVALY
jgi:hypothetical protein